jgi:hypothetical protein
LSNDAAAVSRDVTMYVRSVEKGVNDKKRRADRHSALLGQIAKYFKK